MLFSKFLALTGLPVFLGGAMDDWALDPLFQVLAAAAIYAVLGMFLDPLGLMLLAPPVGWFLICGLALVVRLVAFPEISLYLPSTMDRPCAGRRSVTETLTGNFLVIRGPAFGKQVAIVYGRAEQERGRAKR